MPQRTFLVLAVLLSACAPPQEGQRCNQGERAVLRGYGPYGYDVLSCTTPVGCGGHADFRWAEVQIVGHRGYCGCDGVTHYSLDGDFGEAPYTPWRWIGTCEQPCRSLYDYGSGLRTGLGVWYDSAISDICTQCQGALLGGDTCMNGDGIELPRACCNCTDTALAPDGTCRRGEQIVASMCCG